MQSVSCIRSIVILVAVIVGTALEDSPAGAQQMVGLGYLPGYSYSGAAAVSADGSTVVGSNSNQNSHEAFIWTAETGMVGLGHLPSLPYSSASSVSADGSTVVGQSVFVDELAGETGGNIFFYSEAFIWTAETGMVGLGHLPSAMGSEASDVSADGSTIVGGGIDGQGFRVEAFVWKATTGMVGLGSLPGRPVSYANAVSADGSTAVGYTEGFVSGLGSVLEAFIWTPATGMVGLGHLPGAQHAISLAYGVSADGSTVVGQSFNAQGEIEAFVWTAATGMVGLGHLPGSQNPYSQATGVSADGLTVVGESGEASGASREAFAWTAATGMVGLGYLPGFTGSAAYGVSADGSTVVGVSSNAQGNSEAFMLGLDLTPNPAPLILALIAQVQELNLKHGIANSLDSKLDAALQALDDVNENNDVAAVNALSAFINAVQAQRGKAITTDDADALIAAATVIINLLR